MAGIDKIYGNRTQWVDLFTWLAHNKPEYCKYLYTPFWTSDIGPISNFTHKADRWMFKNCPPPWVTDRIWEQYGGKAP